MTATPEETEEERIQRLETDLFLGEANIVKEEILGLYSLPVLLNCGSGTSAYLARLTLLCATATKDTGDMEGALNLTEAALMYYYQEQDESKRPYVFLGDCEFNLTSINKHNNDLSEAIEHSHRAEEHYKRAANRFRHSRILNYRSILYYKLRLFDQAQALVKKAFRLLTVAKPPYNDSRFTNVAEASILHMESVLLMNQPNVGGFTNCAENLERAEACLKTETPNVFLSRKVYAFILFEKARYEAKIAPNSRNEPIRKLKKCLKLRQELGDLKQAANCKLWIAKLYLRGNPDHLRAIDYLARAEKIVHAIKADDLLSEIFRLEGKADFLKSESREGTKEDALSALRNWEKHLNAEQVIQNQRLAVIAKLMSQPNDNRTAGVNDPDWIEWSNALEQFTNRYQREIAARISDGSKHAYLNPVKNWPEAKGSNSRKRFAHQFKDIINAHNFGIVKSANKYHCVEDIWEGSEPQLTRFYEELLACNLLKVGDNSMCSNIGEFRLHFKGKPKGSSYNKLLCWNSTGPDLLYLYHLLIKEHGLISRAPFDVAPIPMIGANWTKHERPLTLSNLHTSNDMKYYVGPQSWTVDMEKPPRGAYQIETVVKSVLSVK